ncbi:L,D-transpeptidase [Mycobacterium sp.]|uniref:L,D-transpeptidase n=1 Tax=Mycobacterium sp. TaxID=1785 RepID=UPI003A866E40
MRATLRPLLAVAVVVSAILTGHTDTALTAAIGRSAQPGVASIQPARGAMVGVAHPVIVTFADPVTDRPAAERAIAVKSEPAMSGGYEWLDNRVVQWVPDRFWPAHSTVALAVGSEHTEFKTGPKVLGVADIENHTFTVSIDGVVAGPTPPLPAPHHRPHWGEDGVLPASMGRPEFATPVGTYRVLSKDRSVTMDSSSVGIPVDSPDGYRLKVDYAVRITDRGLFVHSAPWAESSIGVENTSHGCISLAPTDAEWYYDTVSVGDPVVVTQGVPFSRSDKQVGPKLQTPERPPS